MKSRLIFVVGLVACSRGRSYETRATYDAPKSAFRIIVDAVGTVPAGQDLGAGISTTLVCPRTPGAREVRLDLPPYGAPTRSVTVHDGVSTTSLPWDWKSSAASLTRALTTAGYAPDPVEVEEATRVIDGVSEGPKGTTIAGQAHALTVVAVDFHKSRGPSRCP